MANISFFEGNCHFKEHQTWRFLSYQLIILIIFPCRVWRQFVSAVGFWMFTGAPPLTSPCWAISFPSLTFSITTSRTPPLVLGNCLQAYLYKTRQSFYSKCYGTHCNQRVQRETAPQTEERKKIFPFWLTLSLLPGKQNEVVSQSRGIIGEGELQLEIIKMAHIGNRMISHVGRVSKFIKSSKPGPSDVDSWKETWYI